MAADSAGFTDATNEDMAKVFDVEVAQDHAILQKNGVEQVGQSITGDKEQRGAPNGEAVAQRRVQAVDESFELGSDAVEIYWRGNDKGISLG